MDRIVNACDAGREGELIFREVVSYLGSREAGRAALAPVDDHGRDPRRLRAAAPRARARGPRPGRRVPRARRLADRHERDPRAHQAPQEPPRDARLVGGPRADADARAPGRARARGARARAASRTGACVASFEHDGQRPTPAPGSTRPSPRATTTSARDDRIFDEARARAIVAAVDGPARASPSETRKPSRESAPPLFDLTALQREGNRRFGWSARRMLGAAQRCYEAHKVLTYPRTDSRCLPSDYRATVDEVLRKLAGGAAGPTSRDYARAARHLARAGLENDGAHLRRRQASPTTSRSSRPARCRAASSRGDDRRVYDLVVRRFLGAFHPPAVWERVERTTEVAGERFRTRARALMEPGWRAVLRRRRRRGGRRRRSRRSAPGANEVEGVAVAHRATCTPSPRRRGRRRGITEARLLSLMENAGRSIEDEDLARVMHDKGLGTPATRAEIIENLIAKGYVLRVGKALRPDREGHPPDRHAAAHPRRPARLAGAHRRDRAASLPGRERRRTAADFMGEMADYAREIVERAQAASSTRSSTRTSPRSAPARPAVAPCASTPGSTAASRCPAWPRRGARRRTRRRRARSPTARSASGRTLRAATSTAPPSRRCCATGRAGCVDGFVARGGRTYKGHLEIDHDEWRVRVRVRGLERGGRERDRPSTR